MGFNLKKFAKKMFKNPLSPIIEPFNMVTDGLTDVAETISGKKARDAAKKAQDKEMQNWYLQQEYNTPANQVARLRAAGLNPNLFYEQGNVGNATSAPGVVTVPEKGDMSTMIGYAFQALPFLMQAKQMENQQTYQQDVLRLNTAKFVAENAIRQSNSSLAREKWDYQRNNIDTYGTQPGSTLDFLVKLISNTLGKPVTDVATDTHNYLNDVIKLMMDPIESALNFAGKGKGFAKYGGGTPYERGNVMSKGRYF